jgi:hypothetical protein
MYYLLYLHLLLHATKIIAQLLWPLGPPGGSWVLCEQYLQLLLRCFSFRTRRRTVYPCIKKKKGNKCSRKRHHTPTHRQHTQLWTRNDTTTEWTPPDLNYPPNDEAPLGAAGEGGGGAVEAPALPGCTPHLVRVSHWSSMSTKLRILNRLARPRHGNA